MAEGFDYAAWQQQQNSGVNPDLALLVTFRYEPVKQNDGSWDQVEYIKIWVDKDNEVERPCTDDDRQRFADRYKAFLEGEEKPEDGTPISMCAFATPANVSSCKANKIFTLEQLVATPDERLQRAQLIEFKYRAQDYLKGLQNVGYAGELRERIEVLERENALLKERLDIRRNEADSGDSRRIQAETTRESGIPGETREAVFLTCPYCGATGKGGGMKRWHFDKCKQKK